VFKTAALRKIEILDAKKDAWEIVRLSLFYEFPWDFNRALELSLYKTYAVPSISNTLFRSGEFTNNAQKRYDDTDILLSEIIENGLEDKKGKGWRALQQLNWIHSNFKISNDDYLYVLGTILFGTSDWINKYGYRKLTSNEELAGFYVWKEIGEQMHIKNIPDSILAFRFFFDAYEAKNFVYSEANVKISNITENLMLSWYLPKYMYAPARPFLHAVMQPNLLKAFKYKEPGKPLRNIVEKVLRTRSKINNLFPQKNPYIRTKDYPHKAYPDGYTIETLGPDKLMSSPSCPYHKIIELAKKAN
jgi:hypothetical protein